MFILSTGHTLLTTKVSSDNTQFIIRICLHIHLSGTVNEKFQVEPSDLKINYEKLKVQEKILFFDEVVLYEDELDDNGCTKLSVKLRVMPSGFFVLLRFYLRVDKTLIRVYDTRIYHEVVNNYILREYSEREQTTDKITVSR